MAKRVALIDHAQRGKGDMKKNKGNEFEHTQISWEEFEKEISAGRQEKERDKYEWDRPLVDETWSVDDPVTGELPKVTGKREDKALK